MKLAHVFAAAFLAATPALAQPASPMPPVPESMLDELLTALPHQEEWAMTADPDPQEVARFVALNPGRERDVRTILSDHTRCLAPALVATTRRAIRVVGTRLGADKVRRLIAFYRSDDLRRMDAIDAAGQAGGKITPAQEEELARIRAANPVVAEFAAGIQNIGGIVAEDSVFMNEATRCATARAEALQKAKLKQP